MVKHKGISAKNKWTIVLKDPQFQMKLVPKSQRITKKDESLIGQIIINCYEGSRYKLIIKDIYIDKKKQLCIECLDNDQRLRTLLAKDCKLIKKNKKTGIRTKTSRSSNSKSPTKITKRKRRTTKKI
jgi:hypothetical protein